MTSQVDAEGRSRSRGGWQVARWANPDLRGDGCPRSRQRDESAGVTAAGLITALCRTANLVRAHLDNTVLRRESLDWTTFDVLAVICAHQQIDTAAVAAATGVGERVVADAVAALRAAGLVRQPAHAADGLDRRLQPTPTGELTAAYLHTRIDAVQSRLIAASGPGCLLRRLTDRLYRPPRLERPSDPTGRDDMSREQS